MGEEKVKSTPRITNLAYKIKCNNQLFEFGFGEHLQDQKKINIKAEFELTKEEFKIFFLSIISTMCEYDINNRTNILEEIFKEIE